MAQSSPSQRNQAEPSGSAQIIYLPLFPKNPQFIGQTRKKGAKNTSKKLPEICNIRNQSSQPARQPLGEDEATPVKRRQAPSSTVKGFYD